MHFSKCIFNAFAYFLMAMPLNGSTFSSDGESLYFNEQFSRQANFSNLAIYDEAKRDPIAYWEKCAEELSWYKKWDQVLEGSLPDVKWFASGTLNISYNCVDRHLAAGKADRVALIHINEAGLKRDITYQELSDDVNRIANTMKQLGVTAGDRVAIYMPMMPEAIASMLACTRIGAVHTVIFGGIGAASVKERILDADAKLLITADGSYRSGKTISYKASIESALKECPCLEKVLLFHNINLETPIVEGRDHWYHDFKDRVSSFCPPAEMNAEDPLFILYTSGTTGKPKGLLHTTGGYLVGVHSSFKSVFDIKPNDVYWCTADIGWITGHSYVVYGPLANGATQVIYEGGFDFPQKNRFAQIIDQNQVTIFYTAPTLVRMFMHWGNECLCDAKLDSLRLLGSIGEPINPEAWIWYHQNIGHEKCPIVDTWFQTETGSLVISPLPGITPLKPGSVTKALPGYDVAILNEEGNPSNKGFLAIMAPSPAMMRGIYKDHERYVSTYWSKWGGKYYFAGDFATSDADEYIWVGGRCDEVLKVAGHRIGTAEIENALIECPDVAESAVIGIKDELKGQKIVAFTILKQGVTQKEGLEESLKQLVATQIGSYARPVRIVFVNNLPKTRSGKILRRLLKNLIEGEAIGNTATLSVPSVMDELQPICLDLYKEFYLPALQLAQLSAAPQFKPAPSPVAIGSEKIASIVTPLLHRHLEETNYDRLHLAEQFIDEVVNNQTSMDNVLNMFVEFKPDTTLARYTGGSCYSLTEGLLSELPVELNGFTIGSTLPGRFKQPGQALFSHSAVAICFANPEDPDDSGVVLLDPNFDIEVPIILKRNGKPFSVTVKTKGEWHFMLRGDKILCFTGPIDPVPALEENACMVYELQKYVNPLQVGLKPMIAADRKISLLSRDHFGCHKVHINLHLESDTLLWQLFGEKQPPISFKDFLAGDGFNNEIAELLHTTSGALNSSIRKIIIHKEILNRLNNDYLALISNSLRKREFFLGNTP